MLISFVEILRLLIKIIIKPKEVIKSCDIVAYNKKYCEFVFVVIVLISGILLINFSVSPYYRNYKISSILLLIPLSLYIGRMVIIYIYFTLFRIGTTLSITFKSVELLLLPYIIILLMINSFTLIISMYMSSLKNILQILPYIWFSIQVYFIIKYRFKQSKIRSMILSSIPFILNVVVSTNIVNI